MIGASYYCSTVAELSLWWCLPGMFFSSSFIHAGCSSVVARLFLPRNRSVDGHYVRRLHLESIGQNKELNQLNKLYFAYSAKITGLTYLVKERYKIMEPRWSALGRAYGIIVVVLLACISIACWFLPIEKVLRDFIIWVQTDVGPWGPLVYALGYIPCTVLAVPASLLTLGGGYLFGLVIGFITDSTGSTAGSTAAFLVGRTFGRSYVASKLKDYPQFQAISLAIERQGFKIILLLRMVPLLPFNMLNYILAVTPISCYEYTLASWLGMMPMTLVLVYAGTTIKDITDFSRHDGHLTPARWIMLGSGLFTSVVVVLVVTRIAKDALQRAVEEEAATDEILVVPVAIDAVNSLDPVAELQQPLVVRIDSCDKDVTKCIVAKPVGVIFT